VGLNYPLGGTVSVACVCLGIRDLVPRSGDGDYHERPNRKSMEKESWDSSFPGGWDEVLSLLR
jgi:hypothetical protein